MMPSSAERTRRVIDSALADVRGLCAEASAEGTGAR
jgi:hypothetical protein